MLPADVHRVGLALVVLLMGAPAGLSSQHPSSSDTGASQSPAPPAVNGVGAENGRDQQPVFRTGVNLVRVDVSVTDKQGKPIADLEQSDFEIFEDGKPRGIEAFRLVRANGAVPVQTTHAIRSRDDEQQAAANEDARIFVFFLDDYHVRLNNSLSVRKSLVEFVQYTIAPGDLVAVMYPLTALDGVTLTRDHQSVIRALSEFEGRKFNYAPRHAFERQYAHEPPEVVERIRRQVALSALEGLAVKLGALREERKAVIVVSEGYAALLPAHVADSAAGLQRVSDAGRRNSPIGEDETVDDLGGLSAQIDVQAEVQGVLRAANRSNTALYPVDPRGLATGEFEVNENVSHTRSALSLRQTMDTLRAMADETDGRAILNRNDPGNAMRQIVTDSSVYYLLAYNSAQAPHDGRFHKIKVQVKRSGAQVRSRKGYWAPTAAEMARVKPPPRSAPPPGVARALSSIAEPSNRRYIRTWIGTTRGNDGNAQVTLVWEPVSTSLRGDREAATSVTLSAVAPDGTSYFRGEVARSGTAGAVTSGVVFNVPPGPLQLRVAVDGASGRLDQETHALIVPDVTTMPLALGTARVYVARTARELQIIYSDAAATPTASRDFRRTDRVVIRTEAYAPRGVMTAVSSTLLNKQGERLAVLPVKMSPEGSARSLIDVPLAALAPGEYLIQIVAEGEGCQPVSELVAVRVAG